jgi:hypothetical protein
MGRLLAAAVLTAAGFGFAAFGFGKATAEPGNNCQPFGGRSHQHRVTAGQPTCHIAAAMVTATPPMMRPAPLSIP